MKKVLAICMVLLLACFAFACGKKKSETDKLNASGTSFVSEPETVTLSPEDENPSAGNNGSSSSKDSSSGKEQANDTTKASSSESSGKNSSTTKRSSDTTTSQGEDITYNDDGSFDTPIIPIG